jgi:uncharacterized membrane protein
MGGVVFVAPLADSDIASVLFRSIVLIGLIVGGFFAIAKVRRWLKDEEEVSSGKVGFTLGDLRELHRKGDMTTEEYEKAKNLMLAAGKSMTAGIDPLARPDSSVQKGKPHPRPGR